MSEMGEGAPAQLTMADREIVISRIIAPRELVFEAFTQVRHLSRWWGPEGFSTTTRSFEFRVGGAWDFVMHGPDGTDYQEWTLQGLVSVEVLALSGTHVWSSKTHRPTDTFRSTMRCGRCTEVLRRDRRRRMGEV